MGRRRTFTCPHCEASVPAAALACPECGSDARTGWSEDAEDESLDLPTGYADDEDEPSSSEVSSSVRLPREELRRRRIATVCLLLVACLVAWLVWR